MNILARPLALALVAGTLMSNTPASQFSAELLAFLDPTAAVTNLCGGKSGQSMRDKLKAEGQNGIVAAAR